ncbi:hypothetical protein BFR06_22925 [Burkholderia pseudomallei]|nr:hypothetical protein BFR06_22925 [Burkholderia pseudomallei]APZ16780.1 hypothetical protein BGI52_30445 [Burkholderia pseudomallei]OMX68121.1 hypothetical protein AQ830_01645 [Burkholderia pseudomallei]
MRVRFGRSSRLSALLSRRSAARPLAAVAARRGACVARRVLGAGRARPLASRHASTIVGKTA